jgi:hypothetical protein
MTPYQHPPTRVTRSYGAAEKTHGMINKFANTERRSLVKVLVSVRRHRALRDLRVPEYGSSILSATQLITTPSRILEMIMMMPADNLSHYHRIHDPRIIH